MEGFTRQNIEVLRQDVDRALEAVGKQHGVDLKSGRITYTKVSLKMAVNAQISGLAIEDTPEGQAFMKHYAIYGFDQYDLGRVFHMDGQTMELTGFNMDNPKNLVQLRDIRSGKTYKAPPKLVLAYLAKVS